MASSCGLFLQKTPSSIFDRYYYNFVSNSNTFKNCKLNIIFHCHVELLGYSKTKMPSSMSCQVKTHIILPQRIHINTSFHCLNVHPGVEIRIFSIVGHYCKSFLKFTSKKNIFNNLAGCEKLIFTCSLGHV